MQSRYRQGLPGLRLVECKWKEVGTLGAIKEGEDKGSVSEWAPWGGPRKESRCLLCARLRQLGVVLLLK